MSAVQSWQTMERHGIGMEEQFDEEGMRRVQWARRKERMQREKRKQMMIRRISVIVIPIALILIAVLIVKGIMNREEGSEDGKVYAANQEPVEAAALESADAGSGRANNIRNLQLDNMNLMAESILSEAKNMSGAAGKQTAPVVFGKYEKTEQTVSPGEDVTSSYVILVDVESGNILTRRDEMSRMNPASMTKVMTLLVAVEHIDDLDDTFTMTGEIADYCYVNDCVTAGFGRGDTVTIRDLLYGTILPSGADAALGLATYVAGSQEAFVEMMNEKLKELGMADSAHFTNCIGIYDENHYCTAYDMAIIMENAVNNELCRQVLSAHQYTTSPTEGHPEGIELSNWFLRRIEDKDTGGEVICAKTGYVVKSKSCAVSYGEDKDGKGYICVTGGAQSNWACIYDHVRMYKKYMG